MTCQKTRQKTRLIRAASAAVLTLCLAQSLAQVAHAQSVSASLVDPGTVGGYTGSVKVLLTTENQSNGTETDSNYSYGYGVSGDGKTLFGSSGTSSGAAHAFTWTSADGFTDLGALDNATNPSYASAASFDGSVVVGFSETRNGALWHGFMWTKTGGMVDLGAADNSAGSSIWGVSDDGKVLAGGSFTANSIDRAMRYTVSGGWQNLGLISGTGGYSDAFGISGDGNVIVGMSTVAAGTLHAFRWTQSGGMTDIGTLAGASGTATATATNTDGSVVVGRSSLTTGTAYHAYRWTSTGMADLGTINNATGNSVALGLNGDGTIVVGQSDAGAAHPHAFLWTAGTGMQDLNTVLSTAGVDMTGVELTVARGISRNGQFIAGAGIFPNAPGSTHAFLARIGGSDGGGTGVTTSDSIVQSIQQLAASHTAQMVTQLLTSQTYLGVNEQVSCGSCAGGYLSFGSFNASSHGRVTLSPDLAVLYGLGYGQYEEKGADVTSSLSAAVSLRYNASGMGASRPYFEIGGSYAPSQTVTYSRSYDNGAGTATGQGRTHSDFASAFVRAGWLARLSPRSEAAASLSLTRTRQTQGGYAETGGDDNPFDAVYSHGADEMNIATVGVQYTHLFGLRWEMTADLNASQSFSSRSGVDATVAGAGEQAAVAKELAWYQPGLRVAYRINGRLNVTGFVNATIGPRAIGAGAHGGFGVSYRF